MRTVDHPGPATPYRMLTVPVETAAPIRVAVQPREDLYEAVHREMEMRQAKAGAFVLVSGTVERLTLMTGGPGEGEAPIRFYGPHDLVAPLTVVTGAAGIGLDESGTSFTHCHAAFRDRDGRLVGGHLLPGETIAGEEGLTVDLTLITGGYFQRRADQETRFICFHPEPA